MPGSPSVPRPDPAAHRTNIPFFIACCVFLVFMEFIGVQALKSRTSGPDFRSFYAAGYMVRTHPSTLYDPALQKQAQDTLVYPAGSSLPFYHPSYEALIYAPFTFIPYRAAYLTFIVFNLLLIVAVYFTARPAFYPGLLFFLFVPVMIAVWHGQDSILFLLLCCLAWRQLQTGKDTAAGWTLALAMFRFQLAIPLAILIAIRRGRRFTLAFLAGSCAVALVCFAIVGRAGMASLFGLLSASSMSADQRGTTQQALGVYPQAMSNLRGLLYACLTRHLSPGWAFGVVIAASLAVFLYCAYLVRRERSDTAAFAIAVLCAILVSYHLNIHDLTLLLLPMALLRHRAHCLVLLLCYLLPAILFLFTGPNGFFLLAIPTLALLFDSQIFAANNTLEPTFATSFSTPPAPALPIQD